MFENTAKKIKLCSYLYFFVMFIKIIYKQVEQFIILDCPSDLIVEMILNIVEGFIICFIISLIFYGIGKIVEYFEKLNAEHK